MVGAGFAGLAAAEALCAQGHQVTVLEARDRIGGRVCSVPFGGTTVELGAEFIGDDNTTLHETAARLGLGLHTKGTPYGERVPRGGDPTSLAAMAGVYQALQQADRAGEIDPQLDRALHALGLDPAAVEAVLARLEVTTTTAAADLWSGGVSRGFSGVGAYHTSTLDGGNQQLAHALAARIDGPVRLGAPVTAVEQAGDDVRVVADGHTVDADALVMAVPPGPLGAVEFQPGLPDALAAAHGRVRFGQAAKLFLPLERPHPPLAVLSVPGRFWTYTQLDESGAPTLVSGSFAGSPSALERLEVGRGPERFAAQVRALVPELAVEAEPALLVTWTDLDPWARGSYSAEGADHALADTTLTQPYGRIAFAGEHTAADWHATMEGALRSGLRAAGQISAILAQ